MVSPPPHTDILLYRFFSIVVFPMAETKYIVFLPMNWMYLAATRVATKNKYNHSFTINIF